uniref:Uncharacterized protein n=1 Tax=Lepeophtheirus salmonis TaxID=72036 RepID=A0A0K2TZ76_LEPSM
MEPKSTDSARTATKFGFTYLKRTERSAITLPRECTLSSICLETIFVMIEPVRAMSHVLTIRISPFLFSSTLLPIKLFLFFRLRM